MDNESDGDTNCNWGTWNYRRRIGKVTGRLGNWRASRDHPV